MRARPFSSRGVQIKREELANPGTVQLGAEKQPGTEAALKDVQSGVTAVGGVPLRSWDPSPV